MKLENKVLLKISVISWVWWCSLRVGAASLQAQARLDYIENSLSNKILEGKALKVQRLGVTVI